MQSPSPPVHCMHYGERLDSRGAARGHAELPVALRAAAGAAVSGLSGRHVAGALCRRGNRAAGAARDHGRGLRLRARLHHRVRGARRQRQRDRRGAARLFVRARQHRRHRHHRHGAAFPRHHADRVPDAGAAADGREAGRPVGRLCDGPGLRVRLDAVHRADPRRDPGDRRIGGDRRPWRRPARRLFARARRAVHDRGLRGRSRSPPSWRGFAPISASWKKRWAGCLVLTGIAFLTGWISDAGSWLLDAFPDLGKIAI